VVVEAGEGVDRPGRGVLAGGHHARRDEVARGLGQRRHLVDLGRAHEQGRGDAEAAPHRSGPVGLREGVGNLEPGHGDGARLDPAPPPPGLAGA
jgi:hypothetical protein